LADIRFSVVIDTATGQAAIEKLDKAVGSLGTTAQGTTQVGSAFTSMFAGMTAGIISGQVAIDILRRGYEGLKTFVEGSIRASMEAEMTENRLAAALRATGREVDSNTRYYLAQAQAMASATIYRKDDIASAEAMLLTLGKLNREGMEPATKLVIGLAAVYGGDLQTYSRQVSMGFEGQFIQLGRLIPAVREATTVHDKHAAMIKASAEMYAIAQAQAQTFGGQVEQLKNQFYAFQENVGKGVVHLKSLNDMIFLLKSAFEAMAQAPDPTKGPLGAMLSVVKWISDQIFERNGPALAYLTFEQAKANAEVERSLGGVIGQVVGYTAAGLAAKKHAEALQAVQAATAAYDKALTDLGVKSGETLKADLKDAEAALNLALARRESAGVVEELAKKASDLKTKLEGANFELDKFGHLVPKGSQIWEPFRDLSFWSGEAAVKVGEYTTVLGRLIGGPLGQLIDETHEYNAGVQEGAFQAVKFTTATAAQEAELKKLRDAYLQARSASAEDPKDAAKYAALIKAQKDYNAAVNQAPVAIQKMESALSAFSSVAQPIYQGLSNIQSQLTTNSTIALDNEYKQRLAAIKANVKDETARQQAIMALDAEFDIKRADAARSAAKIGKAVALMGAITSAAQAEVVAMTAPFPMDLILPPIIAAMAAVQIGLIAAQPIPAAKGFEGVVTGPQMFYIEPGMTEHVSIRNRAQGLGGGGAVMHIHGPLVNINTTGLSTGEIQSAAADLFQAIELQARRRGFRLNP
jgi:hypothetical protein